MRVREWQVVSTVKFASQSVWRFLRGFLRGYCDRREEASFAFESVDDIKTNKKYGKRLKNLPCDRSSVCYVLDL